MTEQQARDRLEALGQGHVLRFFPTLSPERQRALLAQIERIDWAALSRMCAMVPPGDAIEAAPGASLDPAPVRKPTSRECARAVAEGEAALRAGKVGVILVAGGQGSRLGFEGPKGCYPVGPISRASLFALHARKVLARERCYGAPVPLYILTSEANDGPSRDFFAQHDAFGLDPKQVLFFTQGMWPALDREGRMLMDRPDRLFMSPDGHGGTIKALARGGMLADMAGRGIETLFYFQVDNPMVNVADPLFVGLHRLERADMSLKVCAKRDPDEGLGVVVLRDGKPAIVEYTELTPQQRHALTPEGELRFRYGSVAIHAFDRCFLEQAAERDLPLHLALKKVPCIDERGNRVEPTTPNGWKFEKFIFDVLPETRRTLNLAFARCEEFSPVKNKEGDDSPATCQRDLVAKYARWLESAGVSVPRDANGKPCYAVEIDPVFADSPAALQARVSPDFRITGDLLLREGDR